MLAILHKHGVECVVVGGIAGTLHGSPLPTSDLDICPSLTRSNLERLRDALNELEARVLMTEEPDGLQIELSADSLQRWIPDFQSLNFKTKYGQLDLLYQPAGTHGYKDLARNAVEQDIGGIRASIAALEDVIRSKSAAGRARDKEHLPTLRLLLEKRGRQGSS